MGPCSPVRFSPNGGGGGGDGPNEKRHDDSGDHDHSDGGGRPLRGDVADIGSPIAPVAVVTVGFAVIGPLPPRIPFFFVAVVRPVYTPCPEAYDTRV